MSYEVRDVERDGAWAVDMGAGGFRDAAERFAWMRFNDTGGEEQKWELAVRMVGGEARWFRVKVEAVPTLAVHRMPLPQRGGIDG